eukprot:GHVP01054242.1.p1 GENE.GHVP01054242.1~~GHVP01054242.1.p1  ORF type:complete len:375 (-),score=52.61 GHVP01054242.1:429-1553(-)
MLSGTKSKSSSRRLNQLRVPRVPQPPTNLLKNKGKYCVATSALSGQIFSKLSTADKSIGARIFVDTPVVQFLTMEESVYVSTVCKLWWSEVYGLSNMKRMLRAGECDISEVDSKSRKFLWTRLLLGESQFVTDEEYERISNLEAPWDMPILRDVERTFPNNDFFANKIGQDNLLRVLRALSWNFPSIGYCQGMNFLAGVFLSLYEEEKATFRCMCGLLKSYQMEEMFFPQFDAVKRKCFQMDALLNTYFPLLGKKFRSLKVTASFYSVQWFMTLLSYDLKPPNIYRIWEAFFIDGWKVIFRLTLVILEDLHLHIKNENQMEENLRFIKARPRVKSIYNNYKRTINLSFYFYLCFNSIHFYPYFFRILLSDIFKQ